MKVKDFLPHKNQFNIYFVTSRQCRLGIAKLKNIFRSFLTHSKKLLQNFKIFIQSNFLLIDWLTHSLMPSDKSNSITTKATGLIFALFDVASSQDVPFHKLQQLQGLHHSSTKAYLCSPLFSPLPRRWRFAVCTLWLWCETRVSAELAGVLLMLFILLKVFEELEAKQSIVVRHDQMTHPLLNR